MEGSYDADIRLERLDLSEFIDYTSQYARLNSMDGLLNTEMNNKGNINRAEEAILSGLVELVDVQLTDEEDNRFLAMEKLSCAINSVDPVNRTAMVDSLNFYKPNIKFELFDSTNNLFRIMNYTMSGEDTVSVNPGDSLSSETDYSYSIGSLSIEGSILDYVDHRTSETFDYHLSAVRMDMDSINSSSGWVNLYANMLLNNRGKLVADIGFNPANPMDIKLEYVITDFQLSDLNIHSRYYMGFPILYGDMYYKSVTEILDGQLKSENKLVIQNVELGNKSGGLYDLPLKFALFLLKDRHGVINLDAPVRGDLKDPKVSIGRMVWNTFKAGSAVN